MVAGAAGRSGSGSGRGMDPEQTFLRVHARLSGTLSQLLTPRIRLALEYLYLAGAVALFCLLVVMHTNFVQQVSHGPVSRELPSVACLSFSIAPSCCSCSCRCDGLGADMI